MRLLRSVLFTVISFTFFTIIAPDADAQTCGNSVCTEGELCLDGDGVIVDGGGIGGCIRYFMGSIPVGNAGLDDYGGFPAGAQVHIEGCGSIVGGALCPITWSIRDNTIESSWPPALPASGRLGQVLTLFFVFGIGIFGIRRSNARRALADLGG